MGNRAKKRSDKSDLDSLESHNYYVFYKLARYSFSFWFSLFTGVSVEKAKPLSNRLDQSQRKLMENSAILQVKAVKELQHPFNQDVRQEAPPSLHCKGDYKLNILDLHPNCF